METKTGGGEKGVAGNGASAALNDKLQAGELQALINQSAIEGIVGTCERFLSGRNVTHSFDTLLSFAELVTKEFATNNPQDFVFCLKESLAQPIREALESSMPHIVMLNDNGEKHNIVKLVRVIAGGEAMIVLDRNAGDAIKAYQSIK